MKKHILIFALITVLLLMSACSAVNSANTGQTAPAAATPTNTATQDAANGADSAEIKALEARIDALEIEIVALGTSSSGSSGEACSCNVEDILVYIRGYDKSAGTVDFDVTEMLNASDYLRVHEHELDGAQMEFNNDYEMFNDHELIQTFKLNEGAKFYLLDENDNFELKASNLAGFEAKVAKNSDYFLCHLTIEAGQVVRVSEQYVP
jgi:uncharacterized protein YceK